MPKNNKMRMPGFTAEASIYQTSKGYRMAAAGATLIAQVVPALPCCSGCDYVYDDCLVCLGSGLPLS